jgi:folate-binding protein YgfZ
MHDPWTWQPAPAARLQQAVTLLHLRGPDTLRFLHGQTSADLERASAGAWIRTCCISPTGRMRALAEVLVEREGAWLVISHGDAAAVRAGLDRVLFPADQVELGALQPAWLLTPLPSLSPAVATPTPAGPPAALQWQALPADQGWRLGPGWLLHQLTALPAELEALPPLGADEQERWRLQQGLPAEPAELNDGTNPFELGLADRVSLSKGCYVGQETLAKLATYDGVKQQLRRWHLPQPEEGSGAEQPTPLAAAPIGAVLLSAEESDGGRCGSVTSALQLASGAWIGLALVRRQALAATELRLGPGGPCVQMSTPAGFMAPPVGAGSGTASGAS